MSLLTFEPTRVRFSCSSKPSFVSLFAPSAACIAQMADSLWGQRHLGKGRKPVELFASRRLSTLHEDAGRFVLGRLGPVAAAASAAAVPVETRSGSEPVSDVSMIGYQSMAVVEEAEARMRQRESDEAKAKARRARVVRFAPTSASRFRSRDPPSAPAPPPPPPVTAVVVTAAIAAAAAHTSEFSAMMDEVRAARETAAAREAADGFNGAFTEDLRADVAARTATAARLRNEEDDNMRMAMALSLSEEMSERKAPASASASASAAASDQKDDRSKVREQMMMLEAMGENLRASAMPRGTGGFLLCPDCGHFFAPFGASVGGRGACRNQACREKDYARMVANRPVKQAPKHLHEDLAKLQAGGRGGGGGGGAVMGL